MPIRRRRHQTWPRTARGTFDALIGRHGGAFYITSTRFYCGDGSAWLVDNGLTAGKLRHEWHRTTRGQQFGVASTKRGGPAR